MKTIKCYGRKKTVALEKSFVKKFFDEDQSLEPSVDSSEKDAVHEKLSFSDFSDEDKENAVCNVSQSPVLFQNSYQEDPCKKSCNKVTKQLTFGSVKKKIAQRIRKEYPKKKKCYRKKPKQIWSGFTKVCRRNQPRWSEFSSYNFTVEGKKKLKNTAVSPNNDRSSKRTCRTQNSLEVIDFPTDITNTSYNHGERGKNDEECVSSVQDSQKIKEKNLNISDVCKSKKELVVILDKIPIYDSLRSSGDLFIEHSKLIKKKKKKNVCSRVTDQTKQNVKENDIFNINSCKTLEQKINHCMKSGTISPNFANSFNTSNDLFPENLSFQENDKTKNKSKHSSSKTSELIIEHEELKRCSEANSINTFPLPKISHQVAKGESLLNPTSNTSFNYSNFSGRKKYGSQEKSLNHVSANTTYDSLHKGNGKLKSTFISPCLSSVFQNGISNNTKSKGKFLTSTPALKINKIASPRVLCIDNVSSLNLNKGATKSSASCFSSSHIDFSKSTSADFDTVPGKENLCCPNEILFVDAVSNDIVESLHDNFFPVSSSSKKSFNRKSYSAPKRVSRSSELSQSLYPVQSSDYSDEMTKTQLLQLCNQDSIIPFADIYDWRNSKLKKIGEGTYGEVFMLTRKKLSCVLKVIPISGCSDNGYYQGLQNVLSEVKISKCLSDLRNNKINQTKNFIKLNRVSLVSGVYPSVLIDAWDSYSEAKSTYNDRPDSFSDNQLFVILELEYGGKDMTCFVLRNAAEAESVLKQITITLAIAEEEFLFEHRDLHLGNILIQRSRRKNASYILRGQNISFECSGLHVTIIDFTLSCLYENGYMYFNDLAEDKSLFNQSGDYQFEIYRNMKQKLENQWNQCSLYSNVLWLKYLCVKLQEYEYSRPSTLAHKRGLEAINFFKNQLTHCNCALACVSSCKISSLPLESDFEKRRQSSKHSILVSRTSFQKSKLSICK